MKLSLKYFRHDHPFIFPRDEDRSEYPAILFERLKHLCSMSPLELQANRSAAIRSHPIDWADTAKPEGFGFPDDFAALIIPWQFSVSANKYGRVHGFWLEDVFYLVWLDPDHELYPGE